MKNLQKIISCNVAFHRQKHFGLLEYSQSKGNGVLSGWPNPVCILTIH